MSEFSNNFTRQLLDWHKENARELPWAKTTDPYKIWLSEIILQQTRVKQGTPYYHKFVSVFPTVEALANASEDKVLKLWEGLGYYSRARNLHHTAKIIANEMSGKFPDTFEGLLALKGIGEYTASAIASFAYGLPYAVVDGNVIRVLSRYFGIEEPADSSGVLKSIKSAAKLFLDQSSPGTYNQAILDLGATVCTPKNVSCLACPVADSCSAYHQGLVGKIPSKSKKIIKKTRCFHYYIFHDDRFILVSKRRGNDIWKGLYEFYLVETNSEAISSLVDIPEDLAPFFSNLKYVKENGPYTHQLTHQNIIATFHFYKTTIKSGAPKDLNGIFYLVEKKKLSTFAFPRVIQKHIIDQKVYE